MELYFKGDQNSALSVRHLSHVLNSKAQPLKDILLEVHDLLDQLYNIESDTNESLLDKTSLDKIELNKLIREFSDSIKYLSSEIKTISVDEVAPSQDVIYNLLQKLNHQLFDSASNIQTDIMSFFDQIIILNLNEINTSINEKSSEFINIKERTLDIYDQALGYVQSIKNLSLVEFYNQSKSHRNNKLEELDSTTALSKWIALLKLEPSLNNFIKSKYEVLIKLCFLHIESKIENGSQVEINNAKKGFVKDAMNKLFEEYYENLSSQIRTNIVMNEDREEAIKKLYSIVQKALERHIDALSELFDEAYLNGDSIDID